MPDRRAAHAMVGERRMQWSLISEVMMEAVSGDQFHSVVISGNQWQSVAISGNQWQSLPIRGNRWQSAALTWAGTKHPSSVSERISVTRPIITTPTISNLQRAVLGCPSNPRKPSPRTCGERDAVVSACMQTCSAPCWAAHQTQGSPRRARSRSSRHSSGRRRVEGRVATAGNTWRTGAPAALHIGQCRRPGRGCRHRS